MFQPFSQENPLHTGTGLGLAIVNSIVKSDGIRGKVDVYSTEGVGTEIRVTIEAEPPSRSSLARHESEDTNSLTRKQLPTAKVFPLAFRSSHRGQILLRDVLSSYMTDWWSASVVASRDSANILLVNEDVGVFEEITQLQEFSKPVVLLTSHRGDSELLKSISTFENHGGLCFIVYKPVRPSHLFKALERAVACLRHASQVSGHTDTLSPLWRPPATQRSSLLSVQDAAADQTMVNGSTPEDEGNGYSSINSHPSVHRRHSEEVKAPFRRPTLSHSVTHDYLGKSEASPIHEPPSKSLSPLHTGKSPGVMRTARVLVVEDNHVNRALLVQWLKKQA